MDNVKPKALCVCSGGGHVTEMFMILEAFSGYDCVLLTYAGANNVVEHPLISDHITVTHYMSGLWAGISFLFSLAGIVLVQRPSVVFSTGGEISVPVIYLSKLLFRSQIVFVESAAQVKAPSFTGRMVHPAADLFLVQWPALKAVYGKNTEYNGGLM